MREAGNLISFPVAIAAYNSFRAWGFPVLNPLNLVISVTNRCQSRCRTCGIWKTDAGYELSAQEYGYVFSKMKTKLLWATISGGEPFLREDLPQIITLLCQNLEPVYLTIPTNGLEPRLIGDSMREILKFAGATRINVNISIDGIRSDHDQLRGVEGAFDRALETFGRLKKDFGSRITLGFHSVISPQNAGKIGVIQDYLLLLYPDTLGAEPAEERKELHNESCELIPGPDDCRLAFGQMLKRIRVLNPQGRGRISMALRANYYDLALRIMSQRRQVIPCFCGFASAQIGPEGEVWDCCIRARSMGNLREHHYDFNEIWRSPEAYKIRNRIRSGECFCPMANAAFVNMVLNPRTLIQVSMEAFGVIKRSSPFRVSIPRDEILKD